MRWISSVLVLSPRCGRSCIRVRSRRWSLIPISAASSRIMASRSGRVVSSPAEAHDGYGARPPCGRLGCLPFRDVQISRRSRLRRVVTKPTPAGCVAGRLRARAAEAPETWASRRTATGRSARDVKTRTGPGAGSTVSAVTCFPPSACPRETPAAGSHARGEQLAPASSCSMSDRDGVWSWPTVYFVAAGWIVWCGAGWSSDRSSLSAGAFSRRERARNGIASAEIPAPNR